MRGAPHQPTLIFPFSIEKRREAAEDVGNVYAGFRHVEFSSN